jgi:D-aspartate ligase
VHLVPVPDSGSAPGTDRVWGRSTVVPALVLSNGRPGLAVTRGLGEFGVPVVVLSWDDRDLASVSRYAVETVRLPVPRSGDPAFVDALLGLADRFAGGVLIPTSDDAMLEVARGKAELSAFFRVDGPDWEVARRSLDRLWTYQAAGAAGIPLPDTVMPSGRADLGSIGRAVGYPCLVKPRESHLYSAHFRRTLTVVRSEQELLAAYDAATDAGLDVLVQELIPGPDEQGVHYDAYRSGARVAAEFTARTLRLAPSRFGVQRAVVSADVPAVVEAGRAINETLGVQGFSRTEFAFDARDGRYKLLQVDGRHHRASLLPIRAGLNFPWISYREQVFGELPRWRNARTGLYWLDEVADLAHSATRAGRAGRGVWELSRAWRGPRIFAVYDRHDLRPFARLAVRAPRRARSSFFDVEQANA